MVARFSDSLWALRLPSALSGVACVGAVLLIGRRWLAPGAALTAAALAALSPMGVYFSQEMKRYSLLAFFSSCCCMKPEGRWKSPGAAASAWRCGPRFPCTPGTWRPWSGLES